MDSRIERDFLGEVKVPKHAYWGISTQRALHNFRISGRKFPQTFIVALARVKRACLKANLNLGQIDSKKAKVIDQAVNEIIEKGRFLDQFPLDVFQTGSGTQLNMNMNEVLANRANEILGYALGRKSPVHPNDHVNKGQSSNDVIPTAMHLAALEMIEHRLYPASDMLILGIQRKIREFRKIVKVGRTHLQDAVPIRLSTEFAVYERQITQARNHLKDACRELCVVPIGGTAVGTGIGADPNFGKAAVDCLKEITGFPFEVNPVKAEGIASHNAVVRASGELRLLGLCLLKMANDIRWMGSGPHAGLGELILPANESGSSLMPQKVNPAQAEALIQVCLQVVGNDLTISFAEAFGSTLDLNVAKPLMICSLLDSIDLLSNAISSFEKNCLRGLRADEECIKAQLNRNLMVATRLVPFLGYDKASEIARAAMMMGKSIKQIVREKKIRIKGNLNQILDPRKMA